ncbi:hypothetical protein CROQUDRAFT_662382 [Cronartium quercuum f. sp. fusiforme G11]|uniref:Uncharacterized protein n=1 Tax=Cronartium quercuum f. sp. fusiforme G11 TaxID=708437 RepID=A0A9P6NEK5_9BASI|nr:hypothetical protein CROQUDRAFT_662382 [Cronartium quercuum f. sp. fusiforme G11]
MTPPNALVRSSTRTYVPFYGHPPVCNVADLIEHGDIVLRVIRERGEENEGLVKLYESGRAGQHIPQGSIKSFRQYADYMTLSAIPIWPITPIKVSLFLLFRLLMGDVTNGTPLRNAYLRSLARSLEHYREETARYFLSRWPEAGSWIIRDGRGDPESRNDITHDILRICKQGQNRPIEALLNFRAVQLLVTADNPALTPDAWATRRRLSARWVRDRESANLPERQYAGGKFVGEPPKPPPLSARSTHWNRHLHDLRDGSEETSWIPNSSRAQSESLVKASSPYPRSDCDFVYGGEEHQRTVFHESEVSGAQALRNRTYPSHHPYPLQLHIAPPSPMPYTLSPDPYTSSARSLERENAKESYTTPPMSGLPPITPLSSDPHFLNNRFMPCSPTSENCVLPSLTEAGLHPSNFPLPISPTNMFQNHSKGRSQSRYDYHPGGHPANSMLTPPPTGRILPPEQSYSSSSNDTSPSSIYCWPTEAEYENFV